MVECFWVIKGSREHYSFNVQAALTLDSGARVCTEIDKTGTRDAATRPHYGGRLQNLASDAPVTAEAAW